MTTADKIKHILQKTGWTRGQFATEMGVTDSICPQMARRTTTARRKSIFCLQLRMLGGEMNTKLMNELKELLGLFPRSFINANLEVILIPKTNTYFSVEGVQSRRDIISKLLMWCSRPIVKGQPFRSQKRNNLFREGIKKSFNYYLGTLFSDEDMALIYQRLGNGINPELTFRFIDSGFNMEVLDDDQRCPIHTET